MKNSLKPTPISRKTARFIFLLLYGLFNAAACAPVQQTATLEEASWPVMGTFATVKMPASEKDRLPGAVTICRTTLNALESSLSRFRPDSAISRINATAGGESTQMPQETLALLELALKYAEESGGAFDPTVGPLVDLWGFRNKTPPAQVPSPAQISNALALTGYRYIQISNQTARLTSEGSHLDLGGIAKGYAVDCCYNAMRAANITNFMIDLGGNIRVAGTPAQGRRWRVAVRNPFDSAKPLGVLELANGMAVATSGNYERFVTIAGKTYCHILDPRTGLPVENMAGVTVVSENSALETDGLSTSLFVLGPDAGLKLLALHPAAHAVYIPSLHPIELLLTPGFKNLFTPAPAFQSSVRDIQTK